MAPEDHRTPEHAVEDASRRRPYASSRRVVWISAGISAVVHILALWLYPMAMERVVPDGPSYWYIPPEYRPRGTELIQLQPFAEAEPTPDPDEPEEPEPVEVAPTPVPDQPVPVEGVPARVPTAAEILRPRLGDPRLWRPVDPALMELTEEQVLQLRVEGRLEAWNDSVAQVRTREAEALDWTHTDEDGKQWGVSPGKIHLGDVTIPFPFGFSAPPANRDQVGRRVWEWDEIESGAVSGAVRANWKDRAAAIRARKEAERAIEVARQKARPPPDTTRVNRR